MDRIRIIGGQRLNGTIPISGAKNATLPLMIASLLTEDTLILDNVPRLADVGLLQRILGNHGVDIMIAGKRPGDDPNSGRTLHISAKHIVDTTAPYELVSKMRASFWVVAPLVARMGEAKVSMPGGCAIGTRPVDLLIMALEKLGAEIEIEGGYVIARAKKGLRGGEIVFPKVTVGGTHTALMAAALAKRHDRDRECRARAGDRRRRRLPQQDGREYYRRRHLAHRGGRRREIARRAPFGVAGPYRDRHLCHGGGDDGRRRAAAERAARTAAGRARRAGAGRRHGDADQRGHPRNPQRRRAQSPVEVTTAPFPGFPTDLQAQLMALMTRAKGTSRITETIFENRFMHVQELVRLGAHIHLDGETATIEGVDWLTGAPVMATDLRASVSLVIAGLAAEGETMVNRVYHLDRGFERVEDKLARCGATIERISA